MMCPGLDSVEERRDVDAMYGMGCGREFILIFCQSDHWPMFLKPWRLSESMREMKAKPVITLVACLDS